MTRSFQATGTYLAGMSAIRKIGLANVHFGPGDHDLAADRAGQALKVTSACGYQILEATALGILKGCVTA